MLIRALIALAIIGIIFILLKLIRANQIRSAQRTAAATTMSNENQLLYFSSAVCAQCLGQEEILNQIFVGSEFQGVILKKFSIEDEPELAQRWGVKTIPTTILLSSTAQVVQFNNGLISSSDLLSQLDELKK
ncbi:MAG: thioredoxin family protein [Gammaproteobacteria bacterium]